ncbi:hypothetical protein BDB01DRAFT_715411 [Pilobolus umbonatus]|nr:hypothetical protein BDB01DRAFT_715411 [Pilobolus umbonatus]
MSLGTVVVHGLINDVLEDCTVLIPISNTIIAAGDKMKIRWANSHTPQFESIYLVQSDSKKAEVPIVLASNVSTDTGHLMVTLPRTLIPSNAYFMTLGKPPLHCKTGNLRIVGVTRGNCSRIHKR